MLKIERREARKTVGEKSGGILFFFSLHFSLTLGINIERREGRTQVFRRQNSQFSDMYL